jgi:hypothetical protein
VLVVVRLGHLGSFVFSPAFDFQDATEADDFDGDFAGLGFVERTAHFSE